MSKAAELVLGNAEAPAIATLMDEGVMTGEQCPVQTPAWSDWAAKVKNKARSFGGYAILRTRQGISMFGEPKLESLVTEVDTEDAFGVKSKARSFGEFAILRARQGITMFGEPKLESLVKGADTEDA